MAFENRYRCQDGSYRCFQWSVTPVVKDRVMYGVARDIHTCIKRRYHNVSTDSSDERYMRWRSAPPALPNPLSFTVAHLSGRFYCPTLQVKRWCRTLTGRVSIRQGTVSD